jgi:hypothetical protein
MAQVIFKHHFRIVDTVTRPNKQEIHFLLKLYKKHNMLKCTILETVYYYYRQLTLGHFACSSSVTTQFLFSGGSILTRTTPERSTMS